MDDDLVLNLATDQPIPSKSRIVKKGGRWTDRLKAKRVVKRKTRSETPKTYPVSKDEIEDRPTKRIRTEMPQRLQNQPAPNRRSSQIISSLFSHNPRVEDVTHDTQPRPPALPSNAPLSDASSFSGLDPLIVRHLTTKMKITRPTSIQRSALRALLPSPFQQNNPRDVFIQSQTGSGKTLAFLLPIIQDLLPLSTLSYIDRSIGTLAIIIAPTRELAKQISDVLESLLQLRLRSEDEDPGSSSTHLTRWLVSGLLTGGSTRAHEKARLRKGVPILVSTPGRLLDHLQNTSSFNVGKCRWLVLDEADRLMDLGFEETVTGILKALDGRRKLALTAVKEGKGVEVGGWDWNHHRRTILCSATIHESVQRLAGMTLVDPLMVKATELDKPVTEPGELLAPRTENFTPPSQLSQKYVIVPLKLRLVALVALLRTLIAQSSGRRGIKIIVFLSCTDSVDFHWKLFGGSTMDGDERPNMQNNPSDSGDEKDGSLDELTSGNKEVEVQNSLFPDTSIYRLHGSLPTPTRLASLREFSGIGNKSTELSLSSILLCTSVASRGLDLPLVRAVIQYDLPTEGGVTEYVHRVGRTARAGKGGEAWSIISPSEVEWVKQVGGEMQGESSTTLGDAKSNITLAGVGLESILKTGFGGKGTEYEGRATDVQLSFERWVLRERRNANEARKAYLSHLRAYATHPSSEKHIFHIRHLHLGHLAKSFALRDAPKSVAGAKSRDTTAYLKASRQSKGGQKGRTISEGGDDDYSTTAEKRMQVVVRAQGRLTKKGGIMMSSGSAEFQVMGGSALQKLVQGSQS